MAAYVDPSTGMAVDAYGQPAMTMPSLTGESGFDMMGAMTFMPDNMRLDGVPRASQVAKGMGKGQAKQFHRTSQLRSHGITKMLKNIPNKYSRVMLIERLQRDFKGDMDFLYMPMDFGTNCNVGYAFLNFRTGDGAQQFVDMFDGVHTKVCLPGYNSNKVASVTHAAVQGLEHNIERLGRSPLLPQIMHRVDWQPALFDEDGTMQPFPIQDFASNFQDMPPSYVPTTLEQFLQLDDTNRWSYAEHQLMGLQAAPFIEDMNMIMVDPMAMPFAISPEQYSPMVAPADDPVAFPSLRLSSNVGESAAESNQMSRSPSMLADNDEKAISNASFSPAAKPVRVSSALVNLDRSPTGKRLSESIKSELVRKQVESFFDKDSTLTIEDKKLLRKNMKNGGFIPISTLMQMRAIMYPGHDIMRKAINESDIFAFDEEKDTFRLRNQRKLKKWKDSF
jgi:hypothetical protein